MLRPARSVLVLSSALLACDGDPGTTLLVDLQTDRQPGLAFDAIRFTVGERVELRPVSTADDFTMPSRIIDLDGLPAGVVVLKTEMLRGGSLQLLREMEITLSGPGSTTTPTVARGGGRMPSSSRDRPHLSIPP